ncbi:MAG: PP2C family protein-serine/threonine phosphatase [Kiloniellaceae bacterium]
MSKQNQIRTADRRRRGLAEQLDFLGDLGVRLAEAPDPVEVLRAALPEVLAQLEEAAWPSPESGGDESAFSHAATGLAKLALANAALRDRLAEQLRIGDSLEMAADLQHSLQPDCEPGDLPIWGVNLPARKLSGDFFDFYPLDEARIAFALGDVSGKGMNAALLMAKTIGLFRCLGKRIDAPAQLLEAINAELCETASRGMFVTMVAGHYRTADGTVRLANAGHLPPLLRRRDRSYESYPASAPPLGILPAIRATEERIDLDGGELYVFTDGLTEYRHVTGERLGVEGLIQLIEALAEAPLARRLEELLSTLEQEGGWEARDDLTVLAIDDSWVRGDAGIDADIERAAAAPECGG